MKKTIFALSMVIAAAIALTSFKTVSAPPKLYPELETFFNSLDVKKYDPTHLQSLENIKYNISTSSMDYDDWNLIFYCSENSFRSQASQVFVQTLCYAKKYRKIKVYSAGITVTEVNPKLIAFLSKIGYRITKTDKDGKSIYEVRFSDKADPIILFSKIITDNSLPKKDITSIVVCNVASENDCAALKTETSPLNLPFQKVAPSDPDDKIESILKSIAAEMLYVTSK
jgi:protein-tyrosine-phosphatase